jgi:hypothetical protein
MGNVFEDFSNYGADPKHVESKSFAISNPRDHTQIPKQMFLLNLKTTSN